MRTLSNEVKLARQDREFAPFYSCNRNWVPGYNTVLCYANTLKYVDLPKNVKRIVLVFSETGGPDKFKFSRVNWPSDFRDIAPWQIAGTRRTPLFHGLERILKKQDAVGRSYFHIEYE